MQLKTAVNYKFKHQLFICSCTKYLFSMAKQVQASNRRIYSDASEFFHAVIVTGKTSIGPKINIYTSIQKRIQCKFLKSKFHPIIQQSVAITDIAWERSKFIEHQS